MPPAPPPMIATRGLPPRRWVSEFGSDPSCAAQPSVALAPSPARAAAPFSVSRRVFLSRDEGSRILFMIPSLSYPPPSNCMLFVAAIARDAASYAFCRSPHRSENRAHTVPPEDQGGVPQMTKPL